MTEWLHFHFLVLCIGEGNGNPLQCSCLENPRDGVAQSRTPLKWERTASPDWFWPRMCASSGQRSGMLLSIPQNTGHQLPPTITTKNDSDWKVNKRLTVLLLKNSGQSSFVRIEKRRLEKRELFSLMCKESLNPRKDLRVWMVEFKRLSQFLEPAYEEGWPRC